jgi:hypothetical protein
MNKQKKGQNLNNSPNPAEAPAPIAPMVLIGNKSMSHEEGYPAHIKCKQ